MKKKLVISIVLMIAMLAVAVIAVNSMRFGNIDATWGFVDDQTAAPGLPNPTGASCLRYADGPAGNIMNPNATGQSLVISRRTPQIQGTDVTNWNQIRYGVVNNENDCGPDIAPTRFLLQSGLAFNGANKLPNPIDYGRLTPFPIGKMCHINNPISASNGLNMTYAILRMGEVDCGPNATLVKNAAGDPYPAGTKTINLNYWYRVQLDETSNSGLPTQCKYPSTKVCADAIIPGQAQGQHMFCKFVSADGEVNILDYAVAILGFTKIPLNGNCETAIYGTQTPMPGIFISEEDSTNCTCAWGAITDYVPSAVDMNFFDVLAGEEKIVLRWQTAYEIDNLGFNIYRSESMARENAVQLNEALIVSLVPPGSTYGADYQFVDTTAKPYTTYYYWLEAFDVNGVVTSHGPMTGEWVD